MSEEWRGTKSQRETLRQKFGGRCSYCGNELGPLMLRLSDAEAEPLPAGEPLTDDDGVCIAIGELRALHAILALTPVEGVGR